MSSPFFFILSSLSNKTTEFIPHPFTANWEANERELDGCSLTERLEKEDSYVKKETAVWEEEGDAESWTEIILII